MQFSIIKFSLLNYRILVDNVYEIVPRDAYAISQFRCRGEREILCCYRIGSLPPFFFPFPLPSEYRERHLENFYEVIDQFDGRSRAEVGEKSIYQAQVYFYLLAIVIRSVR